MAVNMKNIYSGSQYEHALTVTLTFLPTRNKASLVTAYVTQLSCLLLVIVVGLINKTGNPTSR
jgi:hypothetical protein